MELCLKSVPELIGSSIATIVISAGFIILVDQQSILYIGLMAVV